MVLEKLGTPQLLYDGVQILVFETPCHSPATQSFWTMGLRLGLGHLFTLVSTGCNWLTQLHPWSMSPFRKFSILKSQHLVSRLALNWPAPNLSRSKFSPNGPRVTSHYCLCVLQVSMAIDVIVNHRTQASVKNYVWVRFHT